MFSVGSTKFRKSKWDQTIFNVGIYLRGAIFSYVIFQYV
jgi:hypothetical protein